MIDKIFTNPCQHGGVSEHGVDFPTGMVEHEHPPMEPAAPTLSPTAAKYLPYLVAISFFMQALDATILNTALPTIARDLGSDALSMHSVVISYMLTVAILIPTSGWVSDTFGSRRTFIGAIVVFCIGSLLCAVSQSVNGLCVSRIVQGIGAAYLMPVGRLTILRSYPRDQFVRVMNMVTIPGLIGPLLGPLLGGFFSQHLSWHWIFLINIPFGIVAGWAAAKLMPNIFSEDKTRLDLFGFLLFAGGLVCLSLSLDAKGASNPGNDPRVFVLLVTGLALLGAYWLHARRSSNALFKPRLFKTRNFTIGILGNLVSRLGGSSMPYLMPLFFQLVLGYSAFRSGLSLLPLALGSIVIKFAVPPLLHRLGYRNIMVVNTLVIGILIGSFALISPDTPDAVLLGILVCLGMANSIQFTCMNTLTLVDLPPKDASSGNALLSVVMQLSISLSVGFAALLLELFRHHETDVTPALLQSTFHATFIAVGCFSIASSLIFMRVDKQKGRDIATSASEPAA